MELLKGTIVELFFSVTFTMSQFKVVKKEIPEFGSIKEKP